MGNPDRISTRAGWPGRAVIPGIAVDLQDAVEPGEEFLGMLTATSGRVEGDDAWWIGSIPTPVIVHQCPEISGFGLLPARVQHRRSRLVHEQLSRCLQALSQPVDDGAEMESNLSNPARQRRAIGTDAGARENLCLAIFGTVIGILRDHDMRQRAVGW